ncbi:MAG: response regulator [Planctomycetes bacterium]|nr:response regulator [Planctomycetota bacterium]
MASYRTPRKRVWFLEDEPDVHDVVQHQFQGRPIDLVPFLTPGPMLTELQTERPDVLIVDLGLPFIDGFEVIERVRADPRTRDLPVVILTCDHTTTSRLRALRLHVRAFILKPYESRDLVGVVEQVAGVPASAR